MIVTHCKAASYGLVSWLYQLLCPHLQKCDSPTFTDSCVFYGYLLPPKKAWDLYEKSNMYIPHWITIHHTSNLHSFILKAFHISIAWHKLLTAEVKEHKTVHSTPPTAWERKIFFQFYKFIPYLGFFPFGTQFLCCQSTFQCFNAY